MPFEAIVLNKTSGEGRLRARSPIDCELQKEYTFIIQAYDCGAGPSGTNWKKSHKWVTAGMDHVFTIYNLPCIYNLHVFTIQAELFPLIIHLPLLEGINWKQNITGADSSICYSPLLVFNHLKLTFWTSIVSGSFKGFNTSLNETLFYLFTILYTHIHY